MTATSLRRTFTAGEQSYTPIPVNFGAIPEELKQLKQWVVWKPKFDPKRPNKVGKVPVPGIRDEALMTGREAFEKYVESSTWAGIGFVLTEEDPYVGVDLDNCLDELSQFTDPSCRTVYDMVTGYAETSPSGNGVRILAKGALPHGKRRKGPIEMYDDVRFLTITGHLMRAMSGPSIPICQRGIETIHKKYLGEEKTLAELESGKPRVETHTILEDDEIIRMAMESAQGEKFEGLWKGTQGVDEDGGQSCADLALCSILAFWCRRDVEQMDRLFRRSGLMRPKWNEDRGLETYGEMTLNKAIRGTGEVFGPNGVEQIFQVVDGSDGHNAVETSTTDIVKRYNKNHAIVMINGSHMIFRMEDRTQMKVSDFAAHYQFRQVVGDRKGSYKKEVDLWLNSPNAARYSGGITFDLLAEKWTGEHPMAALQGDLDSFEKLNLWCGWALEPKTGECGRILSHIKDIICAGDEESYNWLMNWCAHLVQRPEQKPGTVPVLQSGQGTGKDTFVEVLMRIVGRHGMTITSVESELVGSHNQHVQDQLLIFANEAVYSGDRKSAARLKGFITAKEVLVNPKNVNQYKVPNYSRLIMATNEKHAAFVESDDRRYSIFQVSERWNPALCQEREEEKAQKRYFANLYFEIENGGVEAFLHVLREWKVDIPLVLHALDTPAKKRQRRFSLDSSQQWLVESILRGIVTESMEDDGRFVYLNEEEPTAIPFKFCWRSFRDMSLTDHPSKRCGNRTKFADDLDIAGVRQKKCRGVEPHFVGEKQKLKRDRLECLEFPPLVEMRKRMKKFI